MAKSARKFKVGDEVTWTSQAAGSSKTKTGIIVALIPPRGIIPKAVRPPGAGWPRNHESYVVQVGTQFYWPRVSHLLPAREAELFYIQDQDSGGSCVLWWAVGGLGYTQHVENAQVFTREEAREKCRAGRGRYLAWPVSMVSAAAVLHVPLADLPKEGGVTGKEL